MLQNRTWIDPEAEAEFWGHMQRIETLNGRLKASGRWKGLLNGALFRRDTLQRDLDVIHGLAQDLVDRHTVILVANTDQAVSRPLGPDVSEVNAPLRALAGMVVSLRQDRTMPAEASEGKSA